ncbi:hypothetical protein [Algoriphagus halophytocola]|uniref:Sensor of ECF-type sigma factor n=1 Tax=Algoriphagus halophytocola TaxID=2991499 RepID=A0ABY6MGS3_9BACT|nr:hypothetical protein [Algoriphagus sp. TR-M5]UZD23000.1 hypothetical protein OM944_00600 [Algoriphagus sp. TR-M5]
MKKLFIAFASLFILTASATFAQETVDDEITLIQSAFGMDKKMIVEGYMDLSESLAPGFWTIYQAYEEERQIISRERIKIINDFLEGYDNLGEEAADEIAKRTLANDLALAKLHKSYYKKFKKATSAYDAAKFMQIDTYIHNTIRNAMQQEMPFIGENN